MSDIAINPVAFNVKASTSSKPSYLVTLDGNSKTQKRFITLDKPDMSQSYVVMKGCYTEATEENVVENYTELLTSAPKEAMLEITVPWHRVQSIRSLVFRAK